MKHTLFLWFCLVSCAFAEQPWPQFGMEVHLTKVRTSTLPPALTEQLPGLQMFPDKGEKLPDSLKVCQVDLRGDGSTDFFVLSSNFYWVSGDHTIYVFAQRGRTFARVDSFAGLYHGGIYLGPRVGGYAQIIVEDKNPWYKRGVIRSLDTYRRGAYQQARVTYYRRGSDGGLEFIKEGDPKKNSYDGPENP